MPLPATGAALPPDNRHQDLDLDLDRTPPPRPAIVLAPLWERFWAMVIDVVLLYALALGLNLVFAAIAFGSALGLSSIPVLSALNGALILLLAWGLNPLLESSPIQGSPGKRFMWLKVTDLNGDRITLERANGRWLAKLLSLLPCCYGFVMASSDRRRQALHDKLAGTLVMTR